MLLRSRAKHRLVFILAIGLFIVLGVWLFREPLRRYITEKATLANDAPPAEVVEDMIEHAADPRVALLAAWNSGKIVHREVAVRSLARIIPLEQPLSAQLDSLLVSAALDPDLDVRESALSMLQERNHPALPALAAEQLKDADPEVRLLGLTYLKSVSPAIGVPTVMPLLDDPEPLIVATTLKLLERWSGETFGVKLSETASFENERTGLKEYRASSFEKAKAGARRAKAWWVQHQAEFPPVVLHAPHEAYAARQTVPAVDFQLRTLDGQKLRLSDFRGEVVLVNFWTTWCSACLSEIPELITLQRQHKDNLIILGVSLDYVPDEHGYIGGHPAVEEQEHRVRDSNDHEQGAAALKNVREKVARTAKARGINYPILLDERNEVGGCYNGGELPTTVIVDTQGHVWRRFIGARSLSVFEAMITAASQSPTSGGK